MKQVLQNIRSGETTLVDVPVPILMPGCVLVRSSRSLVSIGSERMLVEFGRSGWISKARQQPEKVKQVLDKMRTDGILPTLEAVFSKLDEPMPLGYCNAGEVVEVGEGVTDLRPGDRVASNGPHAEFVCVPRNLVAPIPEGVSDEEAAFTVIASIGLQGVRLAKPELGETVVVAGLGLVGLLTAALLRIHGCRVIGYDVDGGKAELARAQGVDAFTLGGSVNPVAEVLRMTGGVGADAILITASAKSNAIVSEAARMSRKRGRIILVGVVGLELNRSEFYEKELSFQVSCSYGPGRYDEAYEWKGQDYPLPFVRWTENRNFQAILSMMGEGRLDVKPFISEVVPLEGIDQIYGSLDRSKVASLIRYAGEAPRQTSVRLAEPEAKPNAAGGIAVVGSGNFTRMTVLPALKACGVKPVMMVSARGVSGTTLAQKYGIAESSTRFEDALESDAVGAVVITTRHNLHAPMVLQALEAGKHVLVEKPLCLTRKELAEIREKAEKLKTEKLKSIHDPEGEEKAEKLKTACPSKLEERRGEKLKSTDLRSEESGDPSTLRELRRASRFQVSGLRSPSAGLSHRPQGVLMVGYNRRFSPHVRKMRELLGEKPGPMNVVLTVNAGFIPRDSWVQDPQVGGGRILGEACHFVDLAICLTGSMVREVSMATMGPGSDPMTDNASLTLKMENGSHAVIHYFANGHKSLPKERVEVFYQGRVLALDNFRRLTGYGFKGFTKMKGRQDKGHREQFRRFAETVTKGGPAPVPLAEIFNSTATTLAALESLREGKWIEVEAC